MEKTKYLRIEEQNVSSVPVFFNYIEKIKWPKVEDDYSLLRSRRLSGYCIIEATNKIISSIVDFSQL